MRRLVAETRVSPAELVLPLFVREGLAEPRPPEAFLGRSSSLIRASDEAGLRLENSI